MADILFTSLSGSIVASGTNSVRTAGYSQAGLGAATYVYDSAVNSAYVTNHPRAAFIAADGRGFRLQEPVWDFEMFGAIPDDSTDCYSAWTAMKAYGIANKVQPIGGAGGVAGFDYVYSAPSPVRFSGPYYSSQYWSVHLPWQFFSEQEGNGVPGGGHPVRIRFPANSHGLILNNERSDGEYVATGISYNGANGFSLTGIAIVGGGGTNRGRHGIWARCNCHLRSFAIDGFPGNNLHIVADSGLPTSSGTNLRYGNANSCTAKEGVLSNSGVHGVYTAGGDANAIQFSSINVVSAGAGGFIEGAFLGNSYDGVAVHGCAAAGLGRVTYGGTLYDLISLTDGIGSSTTPGTNANVWYPVGTGTGAPTWSGTGTYYPSGAINCPGISNRSLFTNPYIEGGGNISHVVKPARAIQPIYDPSSATFTSWSLIESVDNDSGIVTAPQGMGTMRPFASIAGLGTFHRAAIGGGEDQTILRSDSASGPAWRLTTYGGLITMSYNSLGSSQTWQYHYAAGLGRPSSGYASFVHLFTSFALGPDGTNGRVITVGSAAPTSGDHASGEIVFNNAPSAGGKAGWICVTAGTPGVWKAFGPIDA
jgi:hypothetical protein